jgi:hypothetical protein
LCTALLSSALLSLSRPQTSGFQLPYAPLVLPGPAPLGTVDEQGARVRRQLLQLDLERVGVVLDESSQGFPILLDRDTFAQAGVPQHEGCSCCRQCVDNPPANAAQASAGRSSVPRLPPGR